MFSLIWEKAQHWWSRRSLDVNDFLSHRNSISSLLPYVNDSPTSEPSIPRSRVREYNWSSQASQYHKVSCSSLRAPYSVSLVAKTWFNSQSTCYLNLHMKKPWHPWSCPRPSAGDLRGHCWCRSWCLRDKATVSINSSCWWINKQ